MAAASYDAAVGPSGGIANDAWFDLEGFKNTLKLRAELEGHRALAGL